MKYRIRSRAVVLLLTLLTVPPLAQAQPGPAQSKAAVTPPAGSQVKEVKVFFLRYAEAEGAVAIIGQMLRGDSNMRVSADVRMNSLLATGSAEQLKMIESLVENIDQAPVKGKTKTQIQVFPLMSDAKEIEKSLSQVLNKDVKFTVDRSKNLVIASGTESDLEKVRGVIDLVDRMPPKVEPPLKLRVIWLMSGDQPNAKKLTDDLKPVAVSLGKLGIDNLHVVAQTLINVGEPNSDFSVRGSVGEEDWTFEVSGIRQGDTIQPARLSLSIEAGAGRKSPIEIQAAVTLALKQLAVLGVTQTGPANSVFVVQLVEGL